jgi:tRNA threonylcarbamoyladenosine biosynthesis protein TsaE
MPLFMSGRLYDRPHASIEPIMSPDDTTVIALRDEAASHALGSALARVVIAGFASPRDAAFTGFTMHFSGDLGAGKTTVVRAMLRTLGVEGRVKSPTYTLVEPYVVEMPKSIESRQDVKLHCYHFDFYRFEDPQEWLEAGFRDYFSDAALRLVEWPERAVGDSGTLLPAPDLHVMLATQGEGRVARLACETGLGAAWLSDPRIQTALAALSQPVDVASSKAR